MPTDKPFLIHTAHLEKWRPRAYDLKKNHSDDRMPKYDVASIFKFYSRNYPNEAGGHNINLELQFRVIDDELDSEIKLPTDAGTEVSLLLFDGRPENIPNMLMHFGLLRKSFTPVENKISRSGEKVEVMHFRYSAAGDSYDGYSHVLKATYNHPSSRGDLLRKQGNVIHLAIVQETLQTTLDEYT